MKKIGVTISFGIFKEINEVHFSSIVPDQTGPTGALPPAVELDYNEHAQE